MLGYVTIGVNDLDKAETFYNELLADLGAKTLMKTDRILFIGEEMGKANISLCIPYDENDPHPGNGVMLAIPAGSKEKVADLYDKAIALGGTCEGEPGQRVENVFYGAYVRDLDGNKVCFFVFG